MKIRFYGSKAVRPTDRQAKRRDASGSRAAWLKHLLSPTFSFSWGYFIPLSLLWCRRRGFLANEHRQEPTPYTLFTYLQRSRDRELCEHERERERGSVSVRSGHSPVKGEWQVKTPHFKTRKSWKQQKYDHGSRRDAKPKTDNWRNQQGFTRPTNSVCMADFCTENDKIYD